MTERELLEKFDNVSWNVYAIRRNKRMTQKELAAKAGLSYAAISSVECQKNLDVLASTILMIADALGVSLDELYNTRTELMYPLGHINGRKPWRERRTTIDFG